MLILLEGCNATGKSSLAHRLSEALEWPILKFVAPKDSAFEYFRSGIDDANCFNNHTIIDRCHLSNMVYGRSEGGAVMTFDEWQRIDEWLKELDTWLFLMVGDPMGIAQRQLARVSRGWQTSRTASSNAALQQRFIEAFELSQIETKGTFDYSTYLEGGHFNHLVSEIRKTVE